MPLSSFSSNDTTPTRFILLGRGKAAISDLDSNDARMRSSSVSDRPNEKHADEQGSLDLKYLQLGWIQFDRASMGFTFRLSLTIAI
jgi:hypothetical protein